MSFKVKNAIILAAGLSSRFVPVSLEKHKALLTVRGEILIERQIKQLKDAGINEIIIVTGYMADAFSYLEEKYGVKLVYNAEYNVKNNISSVYAVRDYLKNSYICTSDNYYFENPFKSEEDESYYSAEYSEGYINEWCINTDGEGYISSVTIGGEKSLYMYGHAFWDEEFSSKFKALLEKEYALPENDSMLWESVFLKHTDVLKMKVREYESGLIYEFDTLDELRAFDSSYNENGVCIILSELAEKHSCNESELTGFNVINDGFKVRGFTYTYNNQKFEYIL